MATRTIANFTAGLAGDLDDTAIFPVVNNDSATRRYTLAQVRTALHAGTQLFTGDLTFTDATYDIGKSGATRPRDGFFSRNVTIGGTLAVTGAATLSASPARVKDARIVSQTASNQTASGTYDITLDTTGGNMCLVMVSKRRTSSTGDHSIGWYMAFRRGGLQDGPTVLREAAGNLGSAYTIAWNSEGVLRVTDTAAANFDIDVAVYSFDLA